MTDPHLGILLSCVTLVLWSLTPFFFRTTGRLIGPFATNLLRLSIAFPVLILGCAVLFFRTGFAGFPAWDTTLLLALSGALGLGFGDLLLYRSLFHVGPERSSLLMTLAPVVTAVVAWFVLKELLSAAQIMGMTLILGGVIAAVWTRAQSRAASIGRRTLLHGGWVNGVAAALCQGISSVMAREAFLQEPSLSPLYATTVRIGAGAILIALIAYRRGTFITGMKSIRVPHVLPRIVLGSFSGPIIGMLCYIAAIKYQPAGVVTTITFMTPLLVMPIGAWRYRQRIPWRVLAGALAAITGVILLGLNPG